MDVAPVAVILTHHRQKATRRGQTPRNPTPVASHWASLTLIIALCGAGIILRGTKACALTSGLKTTESLRLEHLVAGAGMGNSGQAPIRFMPYLPEWFTLTKKVTA